MIFGWALAVLMVALVNMETAVVAASPGSRLASWALWGFGCWAMAGLAVALLVVRGFAAVAAFLDAWILIEALIEAVDAVDAAAAWRGARSRAWEGRDARDALLRSLGAEIQAAPQAELA